MKRLLHLTLFTVIAVTFAMGCTGKSENEKEVASPPGEKTPEVVKFTIPQSMQSTPQKTLDNYAMAMSKLNMKEALQYFTEDSQRKYLGMIVLVPFLKLQIENRKYDSMTIDQKKDIDGRKNSLMQVFAKYGVDMSPPEEESSNSEESTALFDHFVQFVEDVDDLPGCAEAVVQWVRKHHPDRKFSNPITDKMKAMLKNQKIEIEGNSAHSDVYDEKKRLLGKMMFYKKEGRWQIDFLNSTEKIVKEIDRLKTLK